MIISTNQHERKEMRMPPAYAQVRVRVQARGGKILGPAATVVPGPQFGAGDSRNAIIVQSPAISPAYPAPAAVIQGI